jgi:Ca-activated chloride channel family protein
VSRFHFLRPEWFIALIPLVILFWLLRRLHLKAGSWQQYCDPKLLPFLVQNTVSQRKSVAPVIALLTGILCITALAGPTWEQRPQPVFKQQSALVIALDLSRSMDATDISPSRLTRALLKVQDILNKRQEGQTALIVFAGDAFAVTPLTEDTETISSQVKSLSTSIMPAQGSRSDSALQLGANLLKQSGQSGGHILLITDGIDPRSNDIAHDLTAQSISTSVLAVGTTDGAPIPLPSGGFFKDNKGEIVIPKLDLSSLRQLVLSGAGQLQVMTTNDSDINRLLAPVNALDMSGDSTRTELKTDSWFEEGPWLLLPALLLAAFAFRRGYIALLVFFIAPLPQPADAADWNTLWNNQNQQAMQLFENNQAKEAADKFNDAKWKAAAQYKAGDYQAALDTFKSLQNQDAETLYNTANAQAKLGQYEQSIENYNKALKLNPQHADALYNREQVEKLKQEKNSEKNDSDPENSDPENSDQENSDKNSSDQKQSDQNNTQNNDQQDQNSPQQSDDKNDASDEDKTNKQQNAAENKKSDTDKQDEKKQPEQSAAENKSDEDNKDNPQQAQPEPDNSLSKEQQQASEQWLRRIPDDPGGLLKRKFKYQSEQRPDNSTSEQQW